MKNRKTAGGRVPSASARRKGCASCASQIAVHSSRSVAVNEPSSVIVPFSFPRVRYGNDPLLLASLRRVHDRRARNGDQVRDAQPQIEAALSTADVEQVEHGGPRVEV